MSKRLIIFFGLVFLVSISESLAQPRLFFPGNDDRLWSGLIRGPCTLIENMPIVARPREVSASAAVLSSIVGYYDQQLPIFGPAVPKRTQQLVTKISKQRDFSIKERDALSKALNELETRTFRAFRKFMSKHPNQTEGAVRSYFLQTLRGDSLDLKLRRLATEVFQTVKVERGYTGVHSALKEVAAAQNPAVVSMNKGKNVYLFLGNFEGRAIVIDSDSAESVRVPAEKVLLTKQDRKSSGKFATRARKLLKGKMLLLDRMTSCKEKKRPAGIKFLDPSKISKKIELFIIREWKLDIPRLMKSIRK